MATAARDWEHDEHRGQCRRDGECDRCRAARKCNCTRTRSGVWPHVCDPCESIRILLGLEHLWRAGTGFDDECWVKWRSNGNADTASDQSWCRNARRRCQRRRRDHMCGVGERRPTMLGIQRRRTVGVGNDDAIWQWVPADERVAGGGVARRSAVWSGPRLREERGRVSKGTRERSRSERKVDGAATADHRGGLRDVLCDDGRRVVLLGQRSLPRTRHDE